MLIRHESHFSVSLIVGYTYFQNLGYICVIINLWIKALSCKKVCKTFYYGSITYIHDIATLTLIMFMLQITKRNNILTLLLLAIVTKIHSFGSVLVQHSH